MEKSFLKEPIDFIWSKHVVNPKESENMLKMIKAPKRSYTAAIVKIFLAGSINMGESEDWQTEVANHLYQNFDSCGDDIVVCNPRRDDWDSTWEQNPSFGTKFNEQVSWELSHLHSSNIIIFNFEGEGASPITLLELGLYLHKDVTKFIVCPKKYFRYGNVKLTAELEGNNVKFYENRNDLFYGDLELAIQRKIKGEK